MTTHALLSATRVRAIVDRINELAGYSAQSAVPIDLYDNTAVNGATVKIWDGCILRSGSPSAVFYDLLCSGSGTVRFDYNGTTAHTAQVSGSNTRVRGTFTPPNVSGAANVRVFVSAPAGGSLQASLYALDEINEPSAYQAMNSSTALTVGQSTTVPGHLAQVEDNLAVLDQLRRYRTVPGFRASEMDLYPGGPQSATRVCRLKVPGRGGYLFYLIGASVLPYEPTSAILLRFYVNTTQLVGSLLIDKGVGEIGDKAFGSDLPAFFSGAFSLDGVTPVPNPQAVLRVHVEARKVKVVNGVPNPSVEGTVAAKIQIIRLDWVGTPNLSLSAMTRPQVGDQVGSLRALWDNTAVLAGDSGTGYGTNGRDISAGYPIGYAVVDGRSHAFHGARDHNGALVYKLHQHGEFWQIVSFRRTDAPFLYLLGKGIEVYRLVVEDDKPEEQVLTSVDDASSLKTVGLAELGLRTGEIYMVRSNVNEEDARIDFAVEGW